MSQQNNTPSKDWAREAERLIERLRHCGGHWGRRCGVIEQALLRAEQRGREGMRTEAVKVVKKMGYSYPEEIETDTYDDAYEQGFDIAQVEVAKAIQAIPIERPDEKV